MAIRRMDIKTTQDNMEQATKAGATQVVTEDMEVSIVHHTGKVLIDK